MSNKRVLKAYVRYDGSNRVVAGSLVLRQKMPKNGHWEELVDHTYLCCNPTTTSTSSTTTTLSPNDCYNYLFINSRGESSLTYTNCSDETVGPTSYNEPTAFNFCSNGDISYTGSSVSVTYEGLCTTTTTTTAVASTTTSTTTAAATTTTTTTAVATTTTTTTS